MRKNKASVFASVNWWLNSSVGVTPEWILATGFWNDSLFWEDAAVWID